MKFTTVLLILGLIRAIAAAPAKITRGGETLGDIAPDEIGVTDNILNRRYVPLENCKAIQDSGLNKTGLYVVQPNDNSGEFTVFCDMNLLGGGWTVIQRRVNNEISFDNGYSAYRNGFGSFFENLWLGLEKIHRLTHMTKETMELYIGLEDFSGSTAHAHYGIFRVENEDAGYTLRIGAYDRNSRAGDSMEHHSGEPFSTYDNDRDPLRHANCADLVKGGWWYKGFDCHDSNLNGVYYDNGVLRNPNLPDGMIWQHWKGNTESLKTVVMAIRPAA